AAAPSGLRWDRRRVALLRARLDPEDHPGAPGGGRALEALVEKARSFGGRVEEVSAAGVIVAFGVEPAEDAAPRAALAALAMVKAAERGRGGGPAGAAVRIGLHVVQALVARLADTPMLAPETKLEAWTA